MLTNSGACSSCPEVGFLGFALQQTSLLDLEFAQAVEVICTFSQCSRWTEERRGNSKRECVLT